MSQAKGVVIMALHMRLGVDWGLAKRGEMCPHVTMKSKPLEVLTGRWQEATLSGESCIDSGRRLQPPIPKHLTE